MHANADLAQSRAGFDRDKLVSLAMFHIRFDVSGMELMDGARVSVGDVTEAMIALCNEPPKLPVPIQIYSNRSAGYAGYAARC